MMIAHRFRYPWLLTVGLLSSCSVQQTKDAPSQLAHKEAQVSQDNILDAQAIKKIEPSTISAPIIDTSAIVAVERAPALPAVIPGGGGGARRLATAITTDSSSRLSEMDMLLHLNDMAIDASGRDHQQSPSDLTLFAVREQLGPGRASRAMAIVHVAMFEAALAIKGGYESYANLTPVASNTSVDAAMAQAAHDTLLALFPSQAQNFAEQLVLDLASIPEGVSKEKGIQLGHMAATAILTMRANDGSNHPEPVIGVDYLPGDGAGEWRKDPISQIPIALGAHWGSVTPFVLQSAEQFRLPPPPALTSAEYTEAFNEVRRLGGDGVITGTERTPYESETGLFWAYDGVPNLCAPPRLYNQIVKTIAHERTTDMLEMARLLALLNVAMADAGIASWESKFYYKFWRPVTAIREADFGTGPSGAGDQNPDTHGIANFAPLGAPASNTQGAVDFTPPFPAYPSGHATFGGAIFQILRRFYGTDEIVFTFISEELNGITLDKSGNARPLKPRTYYNLTQAEEENGQSRIYLGIHWAFDKTGGIYQGNQVANYVFDHLFKPL